MSEGGGTRILVIKLSALGDVVMSIGAFQAIRAQHPEAEIVLLTTPPYAALAEASGCFAKVWLDDRPGPFEPPRDEARDLIRAARALDVLSEEEAALMTAELEDQG